MLIQLDIHHFGLEGLEYAQSADIIRGFGKNDISWIAHYSCDQIQGVLRTVGDHHIIGLDVSNAFQLHDLQHILTQMWITLCRTVLPCDIALVDHHLSDELGKLLKRHIFQIRHAACKRNDFRPRCDCKQCSNLRSSHHFGAVGIRTEPRIVFDHFRACGVRSLGHAFSFLAAHSIARYSTL
ncbi:hypothetical protein BITS_1826 [Bifidobacterium tsurumiense]|uniref:Uncharacterized protein n=1 Tax=Bifidobacterium tsurumiense TaxID=356829 RepID=A0A087ED78_9BIFI|nr:hypothetical protein BITS_1826 [Bifidobacterium tsurumiense]